MTGEEFQRLVHEKIVLLDGATGTNLFQDGLSEGECPEVWITQHSEILIELQKEYVRNGSNIIYAPTFGANRSRLSKYGYDDSVKELNIRLVELSKKAADHTAWVAGNLSMTGRVSKQTDDPDLEELVAIYKEQVAALSEAGVDLIAIETMQSLSETRAAVIACKEVAPELAIMATLTFNEDGYTEMEVAPAAAVVTLQDMGVSAVGFNCSLEPQKMRTVVIQMAEVAKVPIIAKPNAGLPYKNDAGSLIYDLNAETFTDQMEELLQYGATILGGCCGTTPSYISELRELAESVEGIEVDFEDVANLVFLSDDRRCYSFPAGIPLQRPDTIRLSDRADTKEAREHEWNEIAAHLVRMQNHSPDAVIVKIEKENLTDIPELISKIAQEAETPVLIETDRKKTAEFLARRYCGLLGIIYKGNEDISTLKRYGTKLVTIDNNIVSC